MTEKEIIKKCYLDLCQASIEREYIQLEKEKP